MKRPASEMGDVSGGTATLGDAARKARLDDGSNAALELGIDSDDDNFDVGSDFGDELGDGLPGEGEGQGLGTSMERGDKQKEDDDSKDMSNIPQEALIRRRLARMRDLNKLYEDQYWRLLEDLRKHHYRFALRHGHGGRKDDALTETQAREKTGGAQLTCCSFENCDERPMPLTTFCFAHILQDTKQVLYTAGSEKDDEKGEPEPVLRTEEQAAAAVKDTPAVDTAMDTK
ncbi:zf-C3Hc3H domain-containing protein [bacterium]|nr:zf-C3Hc3H domain-containing protein [bacterium]